MKNSFGNSISLSVFGESHGDAIGVLLDGIAPGIKIDRDYIDQKLELRKPYGSISTARHEPDEYKILSGVFGGYTTGTPIAIIIENKDTQSKDYSGLLYTPRPSHADYTASCKYHGFQDYRGGGHFSGRITAPIVVAGAIVMKALESKGIRIGTHIRELHGVSDRDFLDYEKDIDYLSSARFPVLSDDQSAKMQNEIEKAREKQDSVGGILESVIIGVPSGVGEPFFDGIESVLSHLLFSVPALKGIEFGAGFAFSDMYGSEANDPFSMSGEKVITTSNNNAGINGGISNGMPIIIKSVIKPTPSIFQKQNTVNLSTKENTVLELSGRHDCAIIHRARIVVDSLIAIGIADILTARFGTDYLA